MEQLAAAAAEADPAAQPAAEPAAGDGQPAEAAADASAAPDPDGAAAADDAKPKGTRKRGLEKMEADLVELRVKISKKQNVISSAMGRASHTKAQRESLEKARNELTRLSALATAKSKEIERARAARAAKEKQAAEKQAAKDLAAAADAHMTEAGAIQLVELVMQYSSRLANTSDKVDDVWKHIHLAFMKLIVEGELPESDGRPLAALRSRFAPPRARPPASARAHSAYSTPHAILARRADPSPRAALGTARSSGSSATGPRWRRGRCLSRGSPPRMSSTASPPTAARRRPPSSSSTISRTRWPRRRGASRARRRRRAAWATH